MMSSRASDRASTRGVVREFGISDDPVDFGNIGGGASSSAKLV